MRISVALCTFNGRDYLETQLQSIFAQSTTPYEVVVCDDRSSDGTQEILRSFERSAPCNFRFFENDRNLGSTLSFSKAIELCRGDVIALCDQDDWWHPDKLSKFREVFAEDRRTSLVFSDAEVVDENMHAQGFNLWEWTFPEKVRRKFTEKQAFEILIRGRTVTGATMSFRSDFKDLVLPVPILPAMMHDGWIAVLISSFGHIAFIDEPLIKYRLHGRQQLGVPKVTNEVRESRLFQDRSFRWMAPLQDVGDEVLRLTAIKERLEDRLGVRASSAIHTVDQMLGHVYARTNLPLRPLLRARSVLAELVRLRYHRYSNGFRSAAKDLFKLSSDTA